MPYNDITLVKLPDGTYNGKYKDGKKPAINSVSGTIANGSTLTLNGSFSAKRNGDYLTRIMTPAQVGQEPIPSYLVSTAKSWIGSGAAFVAETTVGNQWKAGAGTPIIKHGWETEFYCSFYFLADFINYGFNESLQLKFPRIGVYGGHAGAITPIVFFGSNEDGTQLVLNGTHKFSGGWYASPDSCYFNKEGEQLRPLLNGTWCEFTYYYKASDPGKKNGSVYMLCKNVQTGEIYFNVFSAGINGNDQRVTTELPLFTEPVYWHDSLDFPGGDEFWGFFYKRNSTQLNMWMDGLVANTSPESVHLANGSDYNSAKLSGKTVHIPQTERSASQIKATCYLANIQPNEAVWAFVMNSNGKLSDGFQIRAAS